MRSLLLLALLVALTIPALSAQTVQPAQPDEELKPLIELKLTDLEGKAVPTSQIKGNILVVDFWATWCGPCIAEIPHYNKLQEKYADKGMKIVGVTMASGPAPKVKPFVAKHNMQYTVLMGDDDQGYDLRLMGFPTTYVVTRDWKIFRKYIGASARKSEQIDADIQKLLEMEKQ